MFSRKTTNAAKNTCCVTRSTASMLQFQVFMGPSPTKTKTLNTIPIGFRQRKSRLTYKKEENNRNKASSMSIVDLVSKAKCLSVLNGLNCKRLI